MTLKYICNYCKILFIYYKKMNYKKKIKITDLF